LGRGDDQATKKTDQQKRTNTIGDRGGGKIQQVVVARRRKRIGKSNGLRGNNRTKRRS